MPKISIIVRTKNEERWIGRCLRMIAAQDLRDHEVVLVDNRSTDHTVAVARKYPVKVVEIDRYRPGDALNAGIRASSGEFIVCLSAHCIPQREDWLSKLHANMAREDIAGVYGRQLPMAYSTPQDKRDLLNTFGLDHRVQVKDTFFHNANSMLHRKVWEQVPFDAEATNIEDRIWGKAVIERGWKLAYEPEAAVYHYHGIHQDGDPERAKNVVRILESLGHGGTHDSPANALELLAVLPVLGPVPNVGGRDLLERCLKEVLDSKTAKRVAVLADDPAALATARRLGADALERPPELRSAEVGVERALQYALAACETDGRHYDAVLYANPLFPFRPAGFFAELRERFAESGADSLVPCLRDYTPHWRETEHGLVRADSGELTKSRIKPTQRGLVGLGTLSSSEFIRRGRLLGDSIGLTPLDAKLYSLKANDPFDRAVIQLALEKGPQEFE
jgi:rhamnosyltransferase